MKGSDMPSLNVQPSEDLPVEEMVDLLRGPATSGWPAGWHTWPAAHEARTDFCMLLGLLFLLIVGGGPASLERMFGRR